MMNNGYHMNKHQFAAVAVASVYEAIEDVQVANTANMYAGSLFVACTPKDAAKIETTLKENLNCGVIVSKIGPEFAFDFTV